MIVPSGALVLLVGPSGAGKSSWCRAQQEAGVPAHTFVSSDATRARLYGHELIQGEASDVFALLHAEVAARLAAGMTTVVDATNLLARDRAPLLAIARANRTRTVAVRFDVDLGTLLARNTTRQDPRPETVVVRFAARMASDGTTAQLARELDVVVDAADALRFAPYGFDVPWIHGPFAVIGDVHGFAGPFEVLTDKLLAEGLTLVSVGDLGDRGPDTPGVYRRALELADRGELVMVSSNHGAAFAKKAGALLDKGASAAEIAARLTEQCATHPEQKMTALVAGSLRQFAAAADGDELLARAVAWERRVPHRMSFDDGRVLVVHGGVLPDQVSAYGHEAAQVAIFGTPTGTSPDGMPQGRDSWVELYDEAAAADPSLPLVVFGHIAYDAPRTSRRTVGVDTGAGKLGGGALTAAIVEDGQLSRFASVPIP